VLAVLGGMAALLCLGGLGLGYVLYDQATELDRSAPDVVVDSYLRALLVDRNDATAALHTCGQDADLSAIEQLRSDIEGQERRLDTAISVSWGKLTVQQDNEATASVSTSVQRTATVDGATQSLADDWRFRVVEEGGWRVCGAEEVS
jgi:hypothetical protein